MLKWLLLYTLKIPLSYHESIVSDVYSNVNIIFILSCIFYPLSLLGFSLHYWCSENLLWYVQSVCWIMEIPKCNNLDPGTLSTNVYVPAPFCFWIKGNQERRILSGVLSLWQKPHVQGLGFTASFFNTVSLVFHLSALSQSYWFADISFWFLWVIMSFLSCLQILLRRGEFWNRIHHYFFLSRVNKFYIIFNVVYY